MNERMNRQEILDRLRENERALRARGVTHAALFGSRARGDDQPGSDIDIMIEIAPDAVQDVYAYVGLKSYIAELFAEPANSPDAVTFTSASTAGNLIALLEAAGLTLPSSVVRASIGPVTSRALGVLGLPPHLEAAEPTIAALADTLAGYFCKETNL